MKLLAAFTAMIAMTACTSVSPQGENVRVVNSERALDGCQYVSSVRGDQNLYGGALLARAAYDDAINQMREATASTGGNTLYVQQANTGMMGANARGDAYFCR